MLSNDLHILHEIGRQKFWGRTILLLLPSSFLHLFQILFKQWHTPFLEFSHIAKRAHGLQIGPQLSELYLASSENTIVRLDEEGIGWGKIALYRPSLFRKGKSAERGGVIITKGHVCVDKCILPRPNCFYLSHARIVNLWELNSKFRRFEILQFFNRRFK